MISDNIREYRKKFNMSQDELAVKLGVSRQSISLWETGQTQPTIDNIIALAKIFNISTDTILGNNTEEKKPPEVPETNKKQKNIKKPVIIITVAAVIVLCAVLLICLFIKNAGKDNREGEELNGTGIQTVTEEITDAFIDSETTETDTLTVTETAAETETPETEDISETYHGETVETEESAAEITETETENETSLPETAEITPAPAETTIQITVAETDAPPETQTAAEKLDLFTYYKDFAIKYGTVNGVYSTFSQPSTKYGGYENEYFSLTYWTDSDMVEFCLHCPLSETFSINFFLRMRGGYDHIYEYASSRYYRDTGESLRFAMGYIDPSVFSDSYPLSYESYEGSVNGQDDFLEESRVGICDLIKLIKNFTIVENTEGGFKVFEFKNF